MAQLWICGAIYMKCSTHLSHEYTLTSYMRYSYYDSIVTNILTMQNFYDLSDEFNGHRVRT
jgi:hypothetical protein